MTTFSKTSLLSLCLAGLASTVAFAQESRHSTSGHVGVLTNQINRDIGDVPGNRAHADARFTYQYDYPETFEAKADVSLLQNDQGLLIYSVQELYGSKKGVFTDFSETKRTGDQFRFGRQILDWAEIDSMWGLGKLNNRKNFDFFNPDQEGLVGLSYENRLNNGVFFKVFGSGIYIPEMNPGLDINKKKQTITTRNAWGNPPARTTEIQGNETTIRYIVDYPEIKDVIWRYSGGGELGLESSHFVSKIFFMRKPENQLSTQVEVALDAFTNEVKAMVKPEFYYHDVYGGNIKYRNQGLEVYFGGIGINPNTFPDGDKQATTYTELKTEKRREAYLAWGVSKTNDIYKMGFNYIARVSPFDRDADSLATDPRWNQAVNAHLSRVIKTKFKLMADVKYDMLTTDRLVMLRAGYSATKSLLMTLGVNMIGTPNSGKSFWSPYTNNDALFASLHYVY